MCMYVYIKPVCDVMPFLHRTPAKRLALQIATKFTVTLTHSRQPARMHSKSDFMTSSVI